MAILAHPKVLPCKAIPELTMENHTLRALSRPTDGDLASLLLDFKVLLQSVARRCTNIGIAEIPLQVIRKTGHIIAYEVPGVFLRSRARDINRPNLFFAERGRIHVRRSATFGLFPSYWVVPNPDVLDESDKCVVSALDLATNVELIEGRQFWKINMVCASDLEAILDDYHFTRPGIGRIHRRSEEVGFGYAPLNDVSLMDVPSMMAPTTITEFLELHVQSALGELRILPSVGVDFRENPVTVIPAEHENWRMRR
mmetsp:Transcript_38319/g.81410  ORF Transcript_38319/g.81410 Transcript_38319/m.81410 type:complete len:255 (-) Transcript_38319:1809-2573(-)